MLALTADGATVAPVGAVSLDEPVRCTAAATEALVRRFVADLNGGRVLPAARAWAPAPRFRWYSTSPPGARLGVRAYERASLPAYFRRRVRADERLRLTSLQAGCDCDGHIVHPSGRLVRSAADLRPTVHDFKGTADCESRSPSLIVWSM